MNWITGNNEVKKYEQITSRQSHLKGKFKVKNKDGTESTKVDIDFIRHMQQRAGNPITGNVVEEATDKAKQDAKKEAAKLYETITNGVFPEDKSVKDSAHAIAGRLPRFLRRARQVTADVAKIVSTLALGSIPYIGGCLFAMDYAQNAAPETFKAKEYPSPLKVMRDTIDSCIVGDKLGMSDIREDALDTAHQAVAESFTKDDNKEAIETALNADKAAILGLSADHFVIGKLNGISEKAEIDSPQEDTASTEHLSAVDRVNAAKKAKAKTAEAKEKQKSAEKEAENLVVEKRLLAVRALTEKTDLKSLLAMGTKEEAEAGTTNLDKFLALKPTQMKQVLEAFHLKHFDPRIDDAAQYKPAEELTAAKQDKFNSAIKLVQLSIDPSDQSDKEKTENGNNKLGQKLRKHETGAALHIGKMVGRSIGEKMWAVGSTLRKMKPQVSAVGAVGVAMAAHYALGKADLGSMGRATEKVTQAIGQGTHFQPTTS